MISLLRGRIRLKFPYTLVLEAGGVGYEALCTQEAYERAPGQDEEYELITRMIVREDSITLFGFGSLEERTLFDQITAVSGIGPRTGIAILSGIGSVALREAIRSSDIGRLTGIPNVGRKTAERLIVELRDKLLKEETFGPALNGSSTASSGSGAAVRNDALQALMALGYQRAIAEKAIRNVLRDDPDAGRTTESLVKASLREAVKG